MPRLRERWICSVQLELRCQGKIPGDDIPGLARTAAELALLFLDPPSTIESDLVYAIDKAFRGLTRR